MQPSEPSEETVEEFIKSELERLRNKFSEAERPKRKDDQKELNGKNYFGSALLAKCAQFSMEDGVKFLVKLNANVNARNKEGETAADISWSKRDYVILLTLLLRDAKFPVSMKEEEVNIGERGGKELKEFLKSRKELHDRIKKGDIDYVSEVVGNNTSRLYLGPGNKSGWSCALENRRYDICAIFWSNCPKLHKQFRRDMNCLDVDQKLKIQAALDSYAERFDSTQILKLLAASDIFPETNNKLKDAVFSLFSAVNSYEMGEVLLKVAVRTFVEFEFDFDQDLVDERCVFGENAEAIYLLKVNRIYVAAKNYGTKKGRRSIAGALIHELCHLAMKTVYENCGKPYKEIDEKRRQEYQSILESVSDFVSTETAPCEVLWLAFQGNNTEAELIVRVVHILVMYGKSKGRKILQKQANGLLEFFEKYVIKDCNDFIKGNEPMPSIEDLNKCIGILREEDMAYIPKSKEFKSHTFAGFPAVITSNPKLCFLDRYKKIEKSMRKHVMRKCLFLDLDSFYKHRDKMIPYLEKFPSRNLVLVIDNEYADVKILEKDLNQLRLDNKESLNLIIYSGCKNLEVNQLKILHYAWDDLSESCRNDILHKDLIFQGTSIKLKNLLDVKEVSKIMTSDAIFQVMSQEITNDFRNPSFNEELFVEREFSRLNMTELLENTDERQCRLFLSGITVTELHQHFPGVDYPNIEFSPENKEVAEEKFNEFCKTRENKNRNGWNRPIYWLHFSEGDFFLRSSRGDTENWGKKETVNADELIRKTKKNRFVLLSGDAGLGKTTIGSDLMKRIKKVEPKAFICRVDLNEYAKSDQISLHRMEHTPEEMLNHFFSIIFNEENYFEKLVIRFLSQHSYKVIVFFDGYDEIVQSYKMQAKKILHTILKKTEIQIWVTTRIHEVLNLETEFGISAFEIEYLDSCKQAEFLCKAWKNLIAADEENIPNRLKHITEEMRIEIQSECQNESGLTIEAVKKEIESVEIQVYSITDKEQAREIVRKFNLTEWANILLEKLPSNKNNKSKLFIGIPLHLKLVAELSFRHNLKLTRYSDLYRLYSDLIETRFDIYFREKAEIIPKTKSAQDICSSWKEDFLATHKNIAACEFFPEEYRRDSLQRDMKIKITPDFGLITNLRDYQFLHYTLAEYFLSQWIVDRWKWGELSAKILLKVLIEDNFSITRNFLDSFFKKNSDVIKISSSLIGNLKVEENFKLMFQKLETDFSGAYVWKSILSKFEDLDNNEEEISHLIMIVANFISEGFFHAGNSEDLRKLSIAMTRKMQQSFFHDNLYSNGHLFFYIFFGLPLTDVEKAIEFIRDILTDRKIEPLELRNWWWRNVIHSASRNRDCRVFDRVLAFSHDNLEEEELKSFLLREHTGGMSILHANILCTRQSTSLGLKRIKSMLDEETLSELLRTKDYNGKSYLQKAYLQLEFDELKDVMNCLSDIADRSLLKELLLQVDDSRGSLLSYTSTEEDRKMLLDIVSKYLDEEDLKLFCMTGPE